MKHIKIYENFVNEAKDMPSLDSSTGLIYYFDVPFTSEDVQDILDASKAMLKSKYTTNKQFEVQPMIFIKDKVNGGEHTFSVAQIGILGSFFDKNKSNVASRKDFVNEGVSEDAVYIHQITGCGQDAAQDFIDDNGIDGKKLADYVKQHRDSKEKYDVRDIIAGTGVGAKGSFRDRFIKSLK